MFSHEFERVPVSYDRKLITPQTYQTAIATRAEAGCRFVQLVVENPSAVCSEYVLIFEHNDAQRSA